MYVCIIPVSTFIFNMFPQIISESRMVVEVKPVAGPFVLGEGPHWDEESQYLYFVDIDGCLLCKYDPGTQSVAKCSLGKYEIH